MATDSMEATAAPSFSPVFDNIASIFTQHRDCQRDYDITSAYALNLYSNNCTSNPASDNVHFAATPINHAVQAKYNNRRRNVEYRSAQATATDKCALAEASPSLATDRLALDAAAVTETSAQLQHVAAGATEGVPSIRDAGIAASQATRNGKLLTNAAARGCKSHPATRAVTPDKSVLRDSSVSTQTTQTSCDLPHTSTLDKVGSGGDVTAPTSQTDIFATYSRNDKLEVFDPQFRCVYDVPVRCVRHLPPARLNITRLVLCRNYRPYSTTSCVMGENCKFVHADCDYSTLASRSIHVNYIWSHEDLCTYERLPPGENVEIHFSGGNVTHIASQFLLVTAGVAARRGPSDRVFLCDDFHARGECRNAESCVFAHIVCVTRLHRKYERATWESTLQMLLSVWTRQRNTPPPHNVTMSIQLPDDKSALCVTQAPHDRHTSAASNSAVYCDGGCTRHTSPHVSHDMHCVDGATTATTDYRGRCNLAASPLYAAAALHGEANTLSCQPSIGHFLHDTCTGMSCSLPAPCALAHDYDALGTLHAHTAEAHTPQPPVHLLYRNNPYSHHGRDYYFTPLE